MAEAKKKGVVGIIGLGIMGGAFAKNLAAAGWRVIGFDTDAGRSRAMTRAGVEAAKSAADVAEKAPIIITSLPNPQALHLTIAEIARSKAKARIVAECSTFTLDDKERAEQVLRRAGHIMLDCPVSGTGSQAQTKDLVIYASGDPAAVKKAKRVFADFTRGFYDLGKFGNGSRMKYVANLLVAINNVASAEAMVLGMKAGLDPQMIFDMVRSGAGNSRVFELRAPMMVKNNYDQATMRVDLWQKDMAVIGQHARALDVVTPLFSATQAIYAKALQDGHGAHDTASVCAVLEAESGLRRAGMRGKSKAIKK